MLHLPQSARKGSPKKKKAMIILMAPNEAVVKELSLSPT